MICKKCGKEMDPSWRCCLSCGELNYNHPANQDGNIEVLSLDDDEPKNNIAQNITLYSVNFVLYILSLIGLSVIKVNSDINFDIINSFGYKFIICTISYFYLFCYQLLLKKANLNWWGIFIPIYNLYLIFKLAYGNGWHFLTLFISPILIFISSYVTVKYDFMYGRYIIYLAGLLSTIISLALTANVGTRFGRNGIITILFAFIVIPMIAFNKKYKYYNN